MSAARDALLAAASGALATLALLLSPLFADVPPAVLPYVPLDLRLVALPALFAGAHALVRWARWPRPALVLPALALLAAALAQVHHSAVLGLVAQVPGSAAGERVDVLAALASGASLLVALLAGLERARDRVAAQARLAGLPGDRADAAARAGDAQAGRVLGLAGAALVAFVLAARVGDAALGGAQAPIPEVLGAVLAVGVVALLFPGAARREA